MIDRATRRGYAGETTTGRVRWRLWGSLTAAVVVAGALAWVVLFSPVLAVANVEVTGGRMVSRSAVVRAADVPLGTPLARVDLAAIARRVTGIRRVAAVDVQRRWPSTLRIVVTERRPVAAARVGSRYALYDHTGVLVSMTRKRPGGMPLLRVSNPSPSDPTTRAALAVVSSLPHDLAAKVRVASAKGPTEVRLRLRDGTRVVWGGPGRAKEKARALSALLGKHAHVYDVSSPHVVTTR